MTSSLRTAGPRSHPIATAVLLAGLALPAWADFQPSGGGSTAGLPLYRALVFGGIDTQAASSPGYLAQDILDGVDYNSNVAPKALAVGGGTRSANGATLTGSGWSAQSGFMASRNFASIAVTNAQAGDDYYMVAGQGGTSRVHFDSLAPAASATFTWHVGGNSLTGGFGRADARLDFAATTSPGSDWGSVLFGAGETALTEFGAGTYSYTVQLGNQEQDLFLYWWSSAFTQLLHDSAPSGTDTSLTADYGSTFELIGVQLFDDQGIELSDWTMTDLDTRETVFDAAGRPNPIADAPTLPTGVPEPGALALLALGLAALAGTGRRRP